MNSETIGGKAPSRTDKMVSSSRGLFKLTRQFFVSFRSMLVPSRREPHGLPMPEYQTYFIRLIRHDGHIACETPLVCSDDAEAIRHVEYFVGAFVIELWSGDRVVTRLEAKTK
jgi:hypothetical protein